MTGDEPNRGVPVALTIAGSDSGGGAGIQADLKAFSAMGVYGTTAITALTAQNTVGVQGVFPVDPAFVADQIGSVFDDIHVDAIKIGMLGDPALIRAVASALRSLDRRPPIVLDPVMVAKSGDALLPEDAVATLIAELVPLARVITPNLPEAGVLLGRPAPVNFDEMTRAASDLMALEPGAVLLKGGHLAGGNEVVDVFLQNGETHTCRAPRVDTGNTHGTGCTLSSAIAAGLAKGLDLELAVTNAHAYLQQTIVLADSLDIGAGHGPVHHFHEFWKGDSI